jgi:hypothetical protein
LDGARPLSKARFERDFRSTQASARAVSSWTRNKQWLHVYAACHCGIRWLEVLAQFSLLDKRARKNEGILQAINLPKGDVEKGIAGVH